MSRKINRKGEQFQDFIARLYPEDAKPLDNGRKKLSRTVTFQVTDACNLSCSYCYQIKKGSRKMSFETAKKMVDLLLTGEKGFAEYVGIDISPAIIIEFIGGEPFLEIELIDKVVDYFRLEAIKMRHPWATKFMISICSNGVLYQDQRVQKFLLKNRGHLSFSVTIDGNKELHDSCRLFPDGSPSYDIAVGAAMDWKDRGFYMGSKVTIAPENLSFLYKAISHMVELGYDEIHANCVYEKGWEQEHPTIFYQQLKQTADFFLENIEKELYCSLFDEDFFVKQPESDLENWCGGDGEMLACDPDGFLFPCIRYMESSLGEEQEPLRIGDVDNGIAYNEAYRTCVQCLRCVDRRTQSSDECFYCPIGKGCGWCSAYNYQIHGTVDKRVTYLCEMHKARSLANVYYWNKYYSILEPSRKFKMNCPKEWALNIISEEEYNMLYELQR